ncbi:hypothetical protein A2643_03430 [Candidatus Nomurabacteria bacterium RIFCSPHIGHO2_01_FULL_39_220]|uniref:DoxX family protein n=1 Tax=Candidatus Nomurabacteria bacterium RIFCSPLOWO2_02_FULL_40_67 TaxID=1801787 RepID=A0A1F6Y4L1_9BACT|nr:MAG: hypothetical protein UU01_C0033G0007 [Parcubacteria group bacterium GW2011_GWA2_40_37]OGI62643.1 MAG: hypothetical protein A2W12_03680 [Candidatus Nomurabacteria bacterium RBG_16_40_11]OGI69851.1 MAG: hypothetical protein A2643_03430 [Candidatus Nomurabacteria bacterium RIFCSPHIGHO2_01_FULL_39_220]OGI72764.1 MAG: hypothetical protein A2W56_00040 [Candidatus Nomurabacteria bacterium RIFCSPHIGHO2_02_41_18]OGI81381.1 MAG: hypothetical protein A3E03_03125 [Candidatus Nomurabacteria bacteriu
MTNEKKFEWLLRIGVAGEFAGHGLLAIGHKADWIKWISQMANVDTGVATTMLTVIGILDVIVAIIVLIKPVKPVLLWAALWGFWTALVRPLVGNTADIFSLSSPWLDFIERFANWAAPLALYFFYKNKK